MTLQFAQQIILPLGWPRPEGKPKAAVVSQDSKTSFKLMVAANELMGLSSMTTCKQDKVQYQIWLLR